MKYSEILRVIGQIKSRMGSILKYQNGRGHQDTRLCGKILSTEAELNFICDKLAKDALSDAFLSGRHLN